VEERREDIRISLLRGAKQDWGRLQAGGGGTVQLGSQVCPLKEMQEEGRATQEKQGLPFCTCGV
jgi:hypothetical protein